MTMPCNDSYRQSTRSTGCTRSTNLPPYLRDHPTIAFNFPGSSGGRSPRSCSGRGRGRGTRGRARSWARSSTNYPKPNQNHDFSHISEKFDEQEVAGEGIANVNANAYDETPVHTSGFDVPSPVASFSEIEFCKELSDNIKRCRFVKRTPIQRYAIPVAMAGRDLMACAQTGSGKTAAFCFPIISGILKDLLERPEEMATGGGTSLKVACPLALIEDPTRELSCQIHEEAKKFSYKVGVKVVVAYGGAPIVQQFCNLEKVVDILVSTPGRLVDMT